MPTPPYLTTKILIRIKHGKDDGRKRSRNMMGENTMKNIWSRGERRREGKRNTQVEREANRIRKRKEERSRRGREICSLRGDAQTRMSLYCPLYIPCI